NFNVDTDYDSYKDKQENYQRVFRGFVCRHQLKLSFDFDMKRLSQALAAIAKCLAQPELSISFTVKDATAVNEALLREATANAKRKAELLCEASGVKRGQLITIDYNWGELDIYSDTRYEMAEECLMEAASMMARSIDIDPDDIDVRDTATFVWEIES
ncbi:SIMPL domain-containing protein, partial [Streptococcus hyovaginalis]|uniref:SIMPL domain-containing protein n=1 Tax=Streptococcus hyovaginalis TaxID=149015 RepID=UPI002A82AAC6